MSNTAQQLPTKTSGETRIVSFDFGDSTGAASGKLDVGETLTGTPTVTQASKTPSTATDLTIGAPAVNVAACLVNGRSCAIGEVVQVTVSGGDNGATYSLKFHCGTNLNETLECFGTLKVEDS